MFFLTRTFLLVRDADKCPAHCPEYFVVVTVILRLRNLNATDDGNIDSRSFRKILLSRLGNKCKVVDLLAQKLLNDMTLD